MSIVARTNPSPAEDDVTDTDDGDTRISAGRIAILCCASCVWRYDCRAT